MHKVVGFQITAANEKKINTFYSETFGWRLSPGPHQHVTDLDTGNKSLEGSVLGRGEHIPDYVSLLVETDDINSTIQKCIDNGAQLVRPTFTLDNGDQHSIIADPEGHVVTLIHKAG